MSVYMELVEFTHPDAEPVLSRQAAELILEIGTYKQTRTVAENLEDMIGRTTVVAIDAYEEVIGTAGLHIVRSNPRLGTLEAVVTDPRKRGNGIGRRVVSAIEAIAFRHGVMELNLGSSLEGIPFYNALGYSQVSGRIFRKTL